MGIINTIREFLQLDNGTVFEAYDADWNSVGGKCYRSIQHMAKAAPKSAVNYIQIPTTVGASWHVPPQPGDNIISFGTIE